MDNHGRVVRIAWWFPSSRSGCGHGMTQHPSCQTKTYAGTCHPRRWWLSPAGWLCFQSGLRGGCRTNIQSQACRWLRVSSGSLFLLLLGCGVEVWVADNLVTPIVVCLHQWLRTQAVKHLYQNLCSQRGADLFEMLDASLHGFRPVVESLAFYLEFVGLRLQGFAEFPVFF